MSETIFDDRAVGYDDIAQSALGSELRQRVHSVVAPLVNFSSAVADLGCGTGIDAAWFATRVSSVAAYDASAEMTRLAEERCGDRANVNVIQADVATLELAEPVDLVLANFGVINCLGELGPFGARLRDMLKPGGVAVIVTMARWCPIELGVAVATANRQLFRRRRTGAIAGGEYEGLVVRYSSARDLAREFGSHFELVHAESLGLALPPYEQRHVVQDRTRLRSVLAGVDRRLGVLGARAGLGDHHLAVFRALP